MISSDHFRCHLSLPGLKSYCCFCLFPKRAWIFCFSRYHMRKQTTSSQSYLWGENLKNEEMKLRKVRGHLQLWFGSSLGTRHLTDRNYRKGKTKAFSCLQVDFIWINRDQKSFEWFVSLLTKLEIDQADEDPCGR